MSGCGMLPDVRLDNAYRNDVDGCVARFSGRRQGKVWVEQNKRIFRRLCEYKETLMKDEDVRTTPMLDQDCTWSEPYRAACEARLVMRWQSKDQEGMLEPQGGEVVRTCCGRCADCGT